MTWWEKLCRRRHELDLTQEAVAAHLRVTRELISYWERGRRHQMLSMTDARKLAGILQVSVDWLLLEDADDARMEAGTEDERALLSAYRRLSPGQREIVRSVAYGFLVPRSED